MLRLTLPRVLLIIASLGTAVVLQSTVFARLGLPGATPDVVLVVVLVIALVAGPTVGAVTGFGAGVLVDIAPPTGPHRTSKSAARRPSRPRGSSRPS